MSSENRLPIQQEQEMKYWTMLIEVCVIALIIVLIAVAVSAQENTGDFRELDPEMAKIIALKNSPSYKAVKERLSQAEAVVEQSRSAFYPSLDVSAGLTQNRYSDASGMTDPDEAWSTGVSATWVLFKGFGNRYALKSANYSSLSVEENKREAERQLILAVAESYCNVQLAIANLKISESDRAFYRKQLEDAGARHTVGSGSLSDVLTLQVNVNSAESSLIEAEKEYETAKAGLAALMGIPGARFKDDVTLKPLEDYSEKLLPAYEELIERAVEYRPDMKQSRYVVQAAQSGVEVSRADYYPTVSLFGAYSGEKEGGSDLDRDDFGSSAGVNVSLNIFSGGLTRAKVAEATSAVREAEYNYHDSRLTVEKDIVTARAEVTGEKKQLKLQKESTDLVKRNRDLIEQEYSAGNASLLKLNEAQSELITNQSRLAQAMVQLTVAWERLEAATGENRLGLISKVSN